MQRREHRIKKKREKKRQRERGFRQTEGPVQLRKRGEKQAKTKLKERGEEIEKNEREYELKRSTMM